MTSADAPDLAILLAAAYRALTERLAEAMDKRHIDGMRPSFGFVIRAVAAEQPTITRAWPRCSMSPSNRRARWPTRPSGPDSSNVRPWPAIDGAGTFASTAKGRKVRATALAASGELERELEACARGGRRSPALRAGLLAIVSQSGALDDVLARRARLVW